MRAPLPVAMFGAALLVLAACGSDGDGGQAASGDTARGRQLFEANCASCHGIQGQGTDSGPPLVHEYYVPSHHADAAFQLAVTRGVQPHHWDFGPMPPVEGLSSEDVSDIVAYVRQLQRDAGLIE